MTKSENTPLNKNELEIVKLTVEGESQKVLQNNLASPRVLYVEL